MAVDVTGTYALTVGVLISIFLIQTGGTTTTLYVGGLFELTNHWWTKHTNFFPQIINYALDGIHNRSDLLSDYRIEMVVKDTEGKNGLAATRLMETVQEGPPKVAIFGPSLSDELTITGQIAPFLNVIELSYVATTASTVDRELFPTLFRSNQNLNDLNPLRIALLKHFGWTKVGTIHYNDDKSTAEMDIFHDQLAANNMTLLTSAVISEAGNMEQTISILKQADVRIIMASFKSSVAVHVFCEAYNQGLYGSSHVWILSGPLLYPDWIKNARGISCTKQQLITASAGHFSLEYAILSKSQTITESGLTSQEVIEELGKMADNTPYTLTKYAGWIYDSAWALAFGLNNSISHLAAQGLSLRDYNYSSTYLDAIIAGMMEADFTGVSGPVSFDDKGGRMGVTYVQTNFNDTGTDVAMYDHRQDNLTWFLAPETMWKNGKVPRDSFIYERQIAETSSVAFGIVTFTNSITFILTFALVTFNVIFRNKRNLKMSSPVLNNVILIGCFMIYTVVCITSLDYRNTFGRSTSSYICMIRAWLMSVGFTFLFGGLFSKTYRVYAVFRDTNLKKKIIRDYHLIGIVAGFLIIDCIILVPWTLSYPLYVKDLVKVIKDIDNVDVIYLAVHRYCYNMKQTYWFAAIYIYKGVLLAFGVFLAWETRNVQIEALNDSKYIGACIYNVVIVCVIGVPIVHVLTVEQKTLSYVLESCLTLFCTAICQCILFIPKIQKINQVHGKFIMSTTQNSYRNNSTGTTVPTATTKVTTVRPIKRCEHDKDSDRQDCLLCDMKMSTCKEENTMLRMKVSENTSQGWP